MANQIKHPRITRKGTYMTVGGVPLISTCHDWVVLCIGFVFWWQSRQNVESNPNRDRGAYVLEEDALP